MAKTKKEQRPLDELKNVLLEMNANEKRLRDELKETCLLSNKTAMEIAERVLKGKAALIGRSKNIIMINEINTARIDETNTVHVNVSGDILKETEHMGIKFLDFKNHGTEWLYLNSDFEFERDGDKFVEDSVFLREKKNAVDGIGSALTDSTGKRITTMDVVTFSDFDGNLIQGAVISFNPDMRVFTVAYPFNFRSKVDLRPMCGDERITLPGKKLAIVDRLK